LKAFVETSILTPVTDMGALDAQDMQRALQLQGTVVLIMGESGAGKSTLINTMFGEVVANAGGGEPVTQGITLHRSRNSRRLHFYDTVGITTGNMHTVLGNLRDLVSKLETGHVLDRIHVVYYVADASSDRMFPELFTEAKKVLNGLKYESPIIILLNKIDKRTDSYDVFGEWRRAVNDPNQVMIEVAAKPNDIEFCKPRRCTGCGCEEIFTREDSGTSEWQWMCGSRSTPRCPGGGGLHDFDRTPRGLDEVLTPYVCCQRCLGLMYWRLSSFQQ
jgi:small GTP-binding protein